MCDVLATQNLTGGCQHDLQPSMVLPMPPQEDRYGVAQLSEPGLPAVLQSLLAGLAGFGAAGRLPQVCIL